MHKIKICMGSSCFSRGNDVNLRLLQEFIQKHDLSAEIDIRGEHCQNFCVKGPVISIDEIVYSHLETTSLQGILEKVLL